MTKYSTKRFILPGLMLLTLTLPEAIQAVPAYPGVIAMEQPDGSILSVIKIGDENGHCFTTTDGYRVMRNDKGFLSYVTTDESGLPVASVMRAYDPANRTQEEIQFLSNLIQPLFIPQNPRKSNIFTSTRSGGENQRFLCSGAAFPAKDSPRALVVLVEYTDVKFSMNDPQDFYNRLLNEEGFSDYNATGSARDFFIENSMGLFTPQFDVYGPIQLKNKMSHYGGNAFGGIDIAPEEMVIEACQALENDVDFSIYDTNNDGQIDNVFVFYAGFGEADSNKSETVWPHSADIVDFNLPETYIFSGKLLNRYGCTNEIDFTYKRPDGIGTFVHEFSHVMGLPDLYSTQYTGSFTPDRYDTLDMGPYNNNGRTPPHYSSFERYSLDWIDPEVLEYTGEYELEPLHISNKAYIIPTEKENEFYLLENRQQECCDTYIPGHGMMVWHIDYIDQIWNRNVVNNTPSHQYVDLIEANNKHTNQDRDGTPFPGTGNVREFSEMTTPELLSWEGERLGVSIHDITEEDGKITFTVKGKTPLENAIESALSDENLSVVGKTLTNNTSDVAYVYDLTGMKVREVGPGSGGNLAPGFYLINCGIRKMKVKVNR